MAWSWSHTNEAYAAAEQNVRNQDREWLEIVYGEWHAAELDDDGELDINSFNEEQYNEALAEAKELADDVLADYIWERMSDAATCDNGGFNAWACPSGCHTVSFSFPKEEHDDSWMLAE